MLPYPVGPLPPSTPADQPESRQLPQQPAVGDPVYQWAAAVEGIQNFQHPGATFRVQPPGQAHGTVGSGSHSQLTHTLGLFGRGPAIGFQVREQALADPGQCGGVEPRGGTEPGYRTRLLRLQLSDHVQNP